MNRELIDITEKFLKDAFDSSSYLQKHPDESAYRLEHSYRVANIGRQIAESEGFDVTAMVIGCLLHDIGYVRQMPTWNERKEHGRWSAEIARPFLENLDLPEEQVNDILYGIAIHVDDVSNFEWHRTSFAETIGDADNIDRFDVYRIYETLEYNQFSKLPLSEKQNTVHSTLARLEKLRDMSLGTPTAANLWQSRIDYYISFYKKLRLQLEASEGVL